MTHHPDKNRKIKKVSITYPPFEYNQGTPMLSQSRQFQWFNNPSYIYPVIPSSAATVLKRHDYKVYFIDAIASNISMLSWFDKIEEIKPDLMFFEVKTPVIYYILDIATSLKDRYPDIYIVFGGEHVTALPIETMNNSKIDFIITGGDFDYSLLNLLEYLNSKAELESGVYYRDIEGEVKVSESVSRKTDIENTPFIDRDLSEWKKYAYKNGNFKHTPGTYIMSARGCMYNKCNFCSWSYLHETYKLRTPENVVDEIEFLHKRYGVREIMDDSSCFPLGQWLSLFCKLMIDRGLNKKVSIGCNICYPSIEFEEYRIMKKAGFRFVLFSLESANQKTLDKLDKNVKVSDVIDSIKMAHNVGLEPHLCISIGYPWETEDDIKKTYKLVLELMKKGYVHTMQASLVVPYPGTKLFDYCKNEGLILTENWALYDMRQSVIKTEISNKKLKAYVRAFYNIAFNPLFLLHRLFSIRSIDDIKYCIKAFQKVFYGHLKDFE